MMSDMERGAGTASSDDGGKSGRTSRPPGSGVLRLIGAFKLAKALALLCGGIAALAFSPATIGASVTEWVRFFHLDPGAGYLRAALARVTGVSEGRLRELGVAMFVYSTLFIIEGVGLVLMKHWAEWVALISTAGLIPVEIYEFDIRHTYVRGGILIINTAVVAYLLYRLLKDHAARGAHQAQ